MYTATKEQIKEWQAKYGVGNIRRFKSAEHDKSAYCRKPDRKQMSYLSQIKDAMQFNEALLKACWLDGDMEFQTNEDIFLGMSAEISKLLEFAEIEVEKL